MCAKVWWIRVNINATWCRGLGFSTRDPFSVHIFPTMTLDGHEIEQEGVHSFGLQSSDVYFKNGKHPPENWIMVLKLSQNNFLKVFRSCSPSIFSDYHLVCQRLESPPQVILFQRDLDIGIFTGIVRACDLCLSWSFIRHCVLSSLKDVIDGEWRRLFFLFWVHSVCWLVVLLLSMTGRPRSERY